MNKRVLLLDGSRESTRDVSGILTGAGYQVETVDSPFGVACQFMRFKPHILLMGLEIPGLNTAMLIELLTSRKYDFDFGIVLHAPDNSKAVKHVSCLKGVCGCIRKDAPADELIRSVNNHMESLLPASMTRVPMPRDNVPASELQTSITT